MEDRLHSLVGRIVHVEQPRLGRAPQPPEAFRIIDVLGLTGVLEPLSPTTTTRLRPGMPLALHLEGDEAGSSLDAVVVEAPPGRDVLQVRLPRLPERREVARQPASFAATIQVIGTAGREHPEQAATVVDLSAAGVRLTTAGPIPAGEHAFVSVALPGEVPVLAIADVVGDPFIVGGRHHIRMAFSMIGDDDRGRLVRHLSGGPVSFAAPRG